MCMSVCVCKDIVYANREVANKYHNMHTCNSTCNICNSMKVLAF